MDGMIDVAKQTLETLLQKMGLEAEVVASEDEERVALEVRGPDTGIVIGKKGSTLDAVQYLVNKIVSRGMPGGVAPKPVFVDAEGYRARRAETLVELAQKLAEQARRTGRPVPANPMSAADRRIIHVALANEPDLSTQSEGEGTSRHLVVIPKGEAQ